MVTNAAGSADTSYENQLLQIRLAAYTWSNAHVHVYTVKPSKGINTMTRSTCMEKWTHFHSQKLILTQFSKTRSIIEQLTVAQWFVV